MNFHASVPTFGVPRSALSTYFNAAAEDGTWPATFGGIRFSTVPSGETIAFATRGS